MCARRDMEGDFLKMHVHRLAVAAGHDDTGTLAFGGTDGTEDPGRGSALILGCRRAGSSLRPATGQFGLLTNPGFVLPPQLYARALAEALFDFCQAGGETFLKSAISSTRCPL